jgi:hypothetical protein
MAVQTFDATHLSRPSDLDAKWLIQAGDNLDYAQPGYDDSRWTLFDPSTSVDATSHARPPIVSARRMTLLSFASAAVRQGK